MLVICFYKKILKRTDNEISRIYKSKVNSKIPKIEQNYIMVNICNNKNQKLIEEI